MKFVICILMALGFATASTDDVIKAVQETKILPAKYSVAAQVVGNEAVISTFRPPEEGTEADFKINAAMIAKALMIDHDYGIAKVKVQFHEPAGTTNFYQQVAVSLAEVKGFAAGVVSKQEFLDSLEVERVPEASAAKLPELTKTEEKPAEEKKVEEKKATESKPAIAVAKPVAPKPTRFTSRRTGISFNLPSGWRAQELISGDHLVKIDPASGLASIELNFESGSETPEQRVANVKARFNYNGVNFLKVYPRTNFGTGPYPGSLITFRYPHEWPNIMYYEADLYFGNYHLYGWSDVPSYAVMGPAWEEILRSMTFPSAKKASAKK